MIPFPASAYSAALPLLRLVDAETAHGLTMRALEAGIVRTPGIPDDPVLQVSCLDQRFRNPLGLAAGFDKNGRAIRPLMDLGFGLVEIGTVTPRPQLGNPKPRLFRLTEDRAVINRMGFNNDGLAAVAERLASHKALPQRLGINIGINKEGADPERDYAMMVTELRCCADYLVVNISSPNTPGLRDLQAEERLGSILQAICDAAPVRPPLLVKIAPDLSEAGLEAVVDCAIAKGVTGLIISNTTIARPGTLHGPNTQQAGGLSGAPLFQRSTEMLAQAFRLARGRLTLIGCGGVRSGGDALMKIRHGASLVQIYTEFAYAGPRLIGRILAEMSAGVREAGVRSVADLIGADVA